jgi:O-antigen ligase
MNRFDFGLKILIVYILYKIYYVSIFPGVAFIKSIGFYIDVIIFLMFFTVTLDIERLLNFKLKINILPIFLLLLTLFFFLFSTFAINAEYIDFHSFAKILVYIAIFLSYFVFFAKNLSDNDNLFEKFMNGILIFSIISSFFSILTIFLGFNAEGRFNGAAVGFFIHPNTTSFVYSLAIPVLIYKYFSKKIKFTPYIILLLFFLFCLILTLSRAGYLAVLISSLFLTYSRSKKIFLLTTVLIIIVLASFLFEILALKTDSSFSRSLLIIAAISLITASPKSFFFGYGVSNALKIFDEEKRSFGEFEVNVNNPHNFILLIMLQYGLLTLLPYITFIIVLIFSRMKKRFNLLISKDKLKVELSIAILLGLFFQNMFEEIIIVPEFPLMPLSIIFMGIIYYLVYNNIKFEAIKKKLV